ncbi:hypothetical protein Nepgr_023118 [Nepenthes gracilis]|uniref:Uncharacterized protein n=1 Tax=Nepenthes gracilis TaxID=150966 RepID=A0AAD3T3R2_NEPGR|nr:hypothetical protein Nepgr_023118 [Nepenthes gracilis]
MLSNVSSGGPFVLCCSLAVSPGRSAPLPEIIDHLDMSLMLLNNGSVAGVGKLCGVVDVTSLLPLTKMKRELGFGGCFEVNDDLPMLLLVLGISGRFSWAFHEPGLDRQCLFLSESENIIFVGI